MFNASQMRSHTVRALTTTSFAALAATLLAVSANAQAASRWQPWLGCWSPSSATSGGSNAAAPAGMLCVVPTAGGSEVDIATVINGKVAHLEHVSPTGLQVSRKVDNCPGWESATWSTDNQRVFLRSEFVCSPTATVKGSGMFAISSDGEFVQIQGTTVNGNTSARAVHYQAAGVDIALAPGVTLTDSAIVTTVPSANGFATQSMRAAAGAPANTAAIIDVSKHVDVAVAGAWLNELGQQFSVNGKQLITLADAGVPPYMIDLMVALSYPDKYAIRRNDGVGAAANETRRSDDNAPDARNSARYSNWDCGYGNRMLAFGYYGGACNVGFYGLDAYGYGLGYGYNGYNYNPYYYGQRPVVIIVRGDESGGVAPVQGRAVKGSGYTHTGGTSNPASTTRASTSSGSSSSGAAATSSSSGSSSSGSSSGGEARTAKPRTPPPPQN